jgi:shikimate kinase
MSFILFGFKSCGKTTLGKAVAKQMGLPFFDTDELLEGLYLKKSGKELHYREIYKLLGEEGFRSLEEEVLEQLQMPVRSIIALGGGLILNPKTTPLLAKLGQFIYLKVSKSILKKRVLEQDIPAYLDPFSPEESFEKMYQERLPLYEKILALPIDLENQTQDQAMQAICQLIIPQSVRNLELELRESSRGSTIASPSVLEIQRGLRSLNPGTLTRLQSQVSGRLRYKQRGKEDGQ